MNKKLRLLVTTKCNNKCPMYCNFNITIENDIISETTTLQEIVDLIYNKLND